MIFILSWGIVKHSFILLTEHESTVLQSGRISEICYV